MAAKWIPDNQLKGMNSNRTCSATKYCHIYCWACCHCRFKDFEALFLPIEYSHTNFLFVCKFYTGVFWSRMEQKEGKTSMIFAFRPTNISMRIGTIVCQFQDFEALYSPILAQISSSFGGSTRMYFDQRWNKKKASGPKADPILNNFDYSLHPGKIFGLCTTPLPQIFEQKTIAWLLVEKQIY